MSQEQSHWLPYGLIGLGIALLLLFTLGSLLWPLVVIFIGLPFLYVARTSRDPDYAYMAIPGALIVGTGLILLYQNTFDHWRSWAYAWTLYFVFMGWSFSFAGKRDNEKDLQELGPWFQLGGWIAFVVGALFFEVLIFNSFGGFGALLPIGLVVLGILMLARRSGHELNKTKPKNTGTPDEAVVETNHNANGTRHSIPVTTDGEIGIVEN